MKIQSSDSVIVIGVVLATIITDESFLSQVSLRKPEDSGTSLENQVGKRQKLVVSIKKPLWDTHRTCSCDIEKHGQIEVLHRDTKKSKMKNCI